MSAQNRFRRTRGGRLRVGLPLGTGAGLAVGAGWIGWRYPLQEVLAPLSPAMLAAGLILMLLGVWAARRPGSNLGARLSVSVLTVLGAVGALEGAMRWLDHDFNREEEAWRRLPPYYREPRVPHGEVYFRREGPEEWRGRPITARLRATGYPVPEAYRDEPEIVVRYDRNGFRNEEPPADWEIAVAGDSFTELGNLRHGELFTTLLSRSLGKRVLNLGVSSTGPMTHLSYLRHFGPSPSLEHALIVFFEANDLDDLRREARAIEVYEATGHRPRREFHRQTSWLTWLADRWLQPAPSSVGSPVSFPVLTFESAMGPIPVDLYQVAPDPLALPQGTEQHFQRFCREYATWAREQGVKPWLAYMPCKARALHSRLRVDAGNAEAGPIWTPNGLPDWVRHQCTRHGLVFLDLTPALTEAVHERGELVFNPLLEIHLNARGSALVGAALVTHLGGSGTEGAADTAGGHR